MSKKVDMLDIHRPEYLNLYDLARFVKAHLIDFISGAYSEQGLEWGRAWTKEFIQRLAEIQHGIPKTSVMSEMKLNLSLVVALHKAAILSGFIAADECKVFWQLRPVINKIRYSFRAFLKRPMKINKLIHRLKLFCEVFCQEMPCTKNASAPAPLFRKSKFLEAHAPTGWLMGSQAKRTKVPLLFLFSTPQPGAFYFPHFVPIGRKWGTRIL
jgi:hypothetical protein